MLPFPLLFVAALLTASLPVAVHAAPPSVEAFFAPVQMAQPRLSPTGRFVAIRQAQSDGRDGLVVYDLEAMSSRTVAHFTSMDVGDFQWVGPERLVFNIADKRAGEGETMFSPGLYGVNANGDDFRPLVKHGGRNDEEDEAVPGFKLKARDKLTWNHFLLPMPAAGTKDEIYLARREFDLGMDLKTVDIVKLDTRSGRSQLGSRPPAVREWILDADGEPRLAMTLEGTQSKAYLRQADGSWRQISEFKAFVGGEGFKPIGAVGDTIYVEAPQGDKIGLFTYDAAAGKLSPQPLIALKDFDFDGALVYGRGKVLGVRFDADAPTTEWFDPEMRAVQQSVDQLLPATVNTIQVARQADSPWVLIDSVAAAQPHSYLIYNRTSKALVKLGDSRSGLQAAALGSMRMVRYAARDGLSIPAWLTLPPKSSSGAKPPLVVLVHGGPHLRGATWTFDPEVQFLASRGYAVLQPEFRGSTGYGWQHFQAGWKQWGLKMQDDIADGARWVAAQGLADPKRICIAGASYGGYAVLMGMARDHDLYRCGVAWAGVTDIQLMYSGHWTRRDDVTDAYKQFGMPVLVGDPVKDAEQLKATSPIQQAAHITQPLLLAYGGSDRRVPIYHGKLFYEAVKAGNPQVQWIEYPEEGHGWAVPKNRYDFWRRVEAFLAQQIGPQ